MAFTVTELIANNFESLTLVGSAWEAIYKIKTPDVNALVLYMEYTKDVSSKIDIQTQFASKWIDPQDYYDELILDESSMVLENLSMELNNEGKKRLILTNIQSEDFIKIKFTPDNLTGADTLVLYINEDKFGGKRGNTAERVQNN